MIHSVAHNYYLAFYYQNYYLTLSLLFTYLIFSEG